MDIDKNKRSVTAIRPLIGLGLFFMSNVVFASLIYDIDRTVANGSVTGTIETDGTIGAITPTPNFIAWSLTLSVPGITSPVLTSANSEWDTFAPPGEFIASATELVFEFNDSGSSIDLKPDDTVEPKLWWSLFAGLPDPGGSSPKELIVPFPLNSAPVEGEDRSGPVVIGVAQANPVPEPTTLALISLGLAGIGFRRYGSKETA